MLTIALLWSSVPLTLLVARRLWTWRRSASVRFVYALFLGTSGWCLSYSFEILAGAERAKLMWAMAQYPFMGILPVAWLGLALTLWRHGRAPPRQLLWALAVVPVLAQPLVWTNELHHLVWREHGVTRLGTLELLSLVHGPGFWVFNIYCLAVIGIGLLILAGLAVTNRTMAISQRAALLLAAALPVLANLLYTLQLGPLPGLDLTPLAFTLSALAAGHTTHGTGFMNIVLMARDMVLEQLPEAVFVLDSAGRVVDANASACALCRATGGYHRGKAFLALVPFAPADWEARLDAEGAVRIAADSVAPGRRYRLQGMLLHRDDDMVAGRVLILTDTSSDELARRHLEAAREAAELANRAKTQFLANMSHEIRTPLNGILGMAQLLQDEALDATMHGYVDMIIRSGEELLGIMSDLLDVAQAESGTLTLHPEAMDIRGVVAGICGRHREKARVKGLAIEHDVAADVPARLLGDTARVRQILKNLVGNAIKFTSEGSIRVSAQWQADDADRTQGRLRLDVSDTGIGIAPEHLQKIFAPFEQVDSSNTRRFGGTGLGLAIVRYLAERMGGRVLVDTAPGRGSTFSVELALEALDFSAAELPRGTSPAS